MCSLQDQEYASRLLDRSGFHLDDIIKAWGATQGREGIKVATVNWTVVVPTTLIGYLDDFCSAYMDDILIVMYLPTTTPGAHETEAGSHCFGPVEPTKEPSSNLQISSPSQADIRPQARPNPSNKLSNSQEAGESAQWLKMAEDGKSMLEYYDQTFQDLGSLFASASSNADIPLNRAASEEGKGCRSSLWQNAVAFCRDQVGVTVRESIEYRALQARIQELDYLEGVATNDDDEMVLD
ncbi:hypothetical protein G7054_g1741 [Neopestalotiopsis clavispora]|nr:hypothetical protein G7054_g1741 [Neopestalotiopsis clavispora]